MMGLSDGIIVIRSATLSQTIHRLMLCLVFACLVFACLPVLAADQVVLSNGDTISGVIVKKDDAKLTIKSEFLGEVSMPWTAVKSITSDSELAVGLPGGELVRGRVSTSGD